MLKADGNLKRGFIKREDKVLKNELGMWNIEAFVGYKNGIIKRRYDVIARY